MGSLVTKVSLLRVVGRCTITPTRRAVIGVHAEILGKRCEISGAHYVRNTTSCHAAAVGVEGVQMFILGVILLILGAVLNVPILYTIGGVLAVVGAILWILGGMDRGIGGRRHYF